MSSAENTKKAKKGAVDYFEQFVKAGDAACDAAQILHNTVSDFSKYSANNGIQKKTAEIHEIENMADRLYRTTVNALNVAFMTPIDRDDIRLLASSIDDVVDSLDDILMDFDIYNITSILPEAIEFSALLLKSCQTLKETLHEFRDYKKSTNISRYMIEINDNEEKGDKIYHDAIRKLFTGKYDAIEIIKWREVFLGMETCCDAIENVADVIESVILKNT